MRDLRLQEMEKAIHEAGTMSMEELCSRFAVSMHTVRRDVADLEKKGNVCKVYGGVTAVDNRQQVLRSFTERMTISADSKRECCRAASSLVRDGDVIFIDSGTTTPYLIDFIADRTNLTIVTHNLNVVERCLRYENLQVIVLPGRLRRETLSLTGSETISALHRYNIKKAFMATTGTTVYNVTNSSPNEYEVKHAAMNAIPEKILLMTTEKFGKAGLMNYASFSDFQIVVTDRIPPEPYLSELEKIGTRLICAEGRVNLNENGG